MDQPATQTRASARRNRGPDPCYDRRNFLKPPKRTAVILRPIEPSDEVFQLGRPAPTNATAVPLPKILVNPPCENSPSRKSKPNQHGGRAVVKSPGKLALRSVSFRKPPPKQHGGFTAAEYHDHPVLQSDSPRRAIHAAALPLPRIPVNSPYEASPPVGPQDQRGDQVVAQNRGEPAGRNGVLPKNQSHPRGGPAVAKYSGESHLVTIEASRRRITTERRPCRDPTSASHPGLSVADERPRTRAAA